ncbi:MAG TPA: hypothetical protein EYO51_01655 [Methylococcaceae bacterium]|nr:hypothetical protein [Methylococcaceae bacterium]HIN69258.1 hypothetical protein [Methylococcales bacterium]HIA46307.1 hypothetical protein [Methylococcaceae bacterium]HIB61862.1 hypothetical protein [Methylococcaceae bacterium]HIO12283.1 hypothetical protein [Methylococcales bacterium]
MTQFEVTFSNWIKEGLRLLQSRPGVWCNYLLLAIVATGVGPFLTPLIYIIVGVLLFVSFADISRHYS